MNRIRELRQAANMTQDDLALYLNVQRSAISKYETGSIPLTDATITVLMELFKCSSDYLLGKSDLVSYEENNSPINYDEAMREYIYLVKESGGINADGTRNEELFTALKAFLNVVKKGRQN